MIDTSTETTDAGLTLEEPQAAVSESVAVSDEAVLEVVDQPVASVETTAKETEVAAEEPVHNEAVEELPAQVEAAADASAPVEAVVEAPAQVEAVASQKHLCQSSLQEP